MHFYTSIKENIFPKISSFFSYFKKSSRIFIKLSGMKAAGLQCCHNKKERCTQKFCDPEVTSAEQAAREDIFLPDSICLHQLLLLYRLRYVWSTFRWLFCQEQVKAVMILWLRVKYKAVWRNLSLAVDTLLTVRSKWGSRDGNSFPFPSFMRQVWLGWLCVGNSCSLTCILTHLIFGFITAKYESGLSAPDISN